MPITIVELPEFIKRAKKLLSADESEKMIYHLSKHPQDGVIIQGTGGIRKLRWVHGRKGKSGGVRIIYYWKKSEDEIWMLTAYEKSKQENIPGHILKRIAEEIKNV